MYPSPFQRFLRRFLVIWIVLVVIIGALFVIFLSPLSPFHRCTLMGCRDTLDLILTHEPPGQYTILLTSPSGEVRRLTCIPGQVSSQEELSALCRVGIVTLYGFVPSQVTVEVTWQAGSYTLSGSPSYQRFRPNGLFCPPACLLGKLSVNLP
jgi:hypothetical protein